MATMSEGNRATVAAEYASELSADRDPIGVTKADLRAAVDALDDYLHTNAATINNAIPQPARGALTTAQKARLMKHVITKRYITGT